MSLSCSCPDGDDFEYYINGATDFSTLETKRRKRCTSCKELIDIGTPVLIFDRWRNPVYDSIEAKISGEDAEIPMASWHMCEKCGEQYLNLEELGFCVNISENMFDLLKEYQEMQKFNEESIKKGE